MSETQLTPEQENLKSQYIKNLDYLGFNASYHEPNITKAVRENNVSFTLSDTARDDKNIKYTIIMSLNSKGNAKVAYKTENLTNGHKLIWPQMGAPIPRKEATEGMLTGGYILTDLKNAKGEAYKVWMGIDKSNPPTTWEQANRLFEKDKKCVITHSGAFAKIPDQYFGHEMTKKDKAILFNGKSIGVATVDLKTGEKLLVDGLRVDFKKDPEGKVKFDFTYSEKKGTGAFLSENELQTLKDAIKQSKAEPTESIQEQETTKAQSVKEKVKEKVSVFEEVEDAPKLKKKIKLTA